MSSASRPLLFLSSSCSLLTASTSLCPFRCRPRHVLFSSFLLPALFLLLRLPFAHSDVVRVTSSSLPFFFLLSSYCFDFPLPIPMSSASRPLLFLSSSCSLLTASTSLC